MKLVILDRDGVINQDSPAFIKSPAEWIPIPGSLEAIARLNQAGYRVVIASNQSGIARQLFDITTLNAIHQKMHAAAQLVGADIDAIFFCPHAAADGCDCRKPKNGMFEEISKRFKLSLKGVPTVGDSLRDLQAGFISGCAQWCPARIATPRSSRMVPTSCGCTPSTLKLTMPALSSGPYKVTQFSARSRSRHSATSAASWVWMRSNPIPSTQSIAAARPTPPTMCGVPASKRCGGGMKVVRSKLTPSIIAPPP